MAKPVESIYFGGELDLFALATNWKAYVKAEIGEYVHGIVLEVGAGIGGTTVALHDGTAQRWVCLEPDPQQARRLKTSLIRPEDASAANVVVGSLRTFVERPLFDCILYLDVLEHIEDDRLQIEMAGKLTRPGGYLVILSPAHQCLFSEFDQRIGHLRRYNKQSLRSLRPPDWLERKLVYLDSVGILLSLGNVWLLRRTLPSRLQIALWDRLCVPMSRFTDHVLKGSLGKSILAVWQKGDSS